MCKLVHGPVCVCVCVCVQVTDLYWRDWMTYWRLQSWASLQMSSVAHWTHTPGVERERGRERRGRDREREERERQREERGRGWEKGKESGGGREREKERKGGVKREYEKDKILRYNI